MHKKILNKYEEMGKEICFEVAKENISSDEKLKVLAAISSMIRNIVEKALLKREQDKLYDKSNS